MNKVRILIVEAEGSDETLRGLMTDFVTRAAVQTQLPEREQPAPITEPPARPLPQFPEKAPRAGAPNKKRQAAPVKASSAPVEGSSRPVVIAALKKRPMSSAEVIAETKLTPSTAYSMLNILKGEGVIEARSVEGSLYKKYFLVER